MSDQDTIVKTSNKASKVKAVKKTKKVTSAKPKAISKKQTKTKK